MIRAKKRLSALRKLRAAREWTAGQLSLRSGVSLATIFQIERLEVSPRKETIAALAVALGMEAADLAKAIAEDREAEEALL